jgi:hypothetical protein
MVGSVSRVYTYRSLHPSIEDIHRRIGTHRERKRYCQKRDAFA